MNHCKTATLRIVYGNNNVTDDSASGQRFYRSNIFWKNSTVSLFDGLCNITILEVVLQYICLCLSICLFLTLVFIGYLVFYCLVLCIHIMV